MAEIKLMFNFGLRRPPSPVENPASPAEIASCRSGPPLRRYVWSHHKNTGFPSRVNHATADYTSPDGKQFIFSLGGYHSSPEDRAKAAKSSIIDRSSQFRTGEIDMHRMDVGMSAPAHLCVIRSIMYIRWTLCIHVYSLVCSHRNTHLGAS